MPAAAGSPVMRSRPSSRWSWSSRAHELTRALTADVADGAHVVAPDREHAAVEVASLRLDHAEIAREQLGLGLGHPLELGQVDGDVVTAVDAGAADPGRGAKARSEAKSGDSMSGSSASTGTP